MHRIQVIDSHTGGEPTRLVVGGPRPRPRQHGRAPARCWRATTTTAARATVQRAARHRRDGRRAAVRAGRRRTRAAGVIFFNNVGYLGMCGHGTIGLVVVAGAPGPHRRRASTASRRRSAPSTATLHDDGAVTVRNVPATGTCTQVPVDVPGHGPRARRRRLGRQLVLPRRATTASASASDNVAALTAFTGGDPPGAGARRASPARTARRSTTSNCSPAPTAGADSRNFVLCPGKAYDRSPCGTGTSAKLACLAADGKLAPGRRLAAGEHHRQRVRGQLRAATAARSIPTHHAAARTSPPKATLLLDDGDPFGWGIRAELAACDADVIVVGAGIVGAACAHALARPGCAVLVLDARHRRRARRPAWATSS